MILLQVFLRACFWAFFLLATLHCCGQYDTTAFYVKKYSAYEGLPDSYTLDVFQDSKQYLWIGTYSGLSRFDGVSFSNFGIRNGLNDHYVSKFIEFDNHIWVGNRSHVGYMHENRFVETPFEDSAKRLSFVYGFNKLPSGKLCVITSKGMYEWHDSLWIKCSMIPEVKNGFCQNVLELHGKTYFFFFDKIIVLEKNGDKKVIPISGDDEEYFQWARKFGDQIFILTKEGLFEIQDFSTIPIFSRKLNSKNVTCFFRDSEKRFWVATRDGLLVSRPGELNDFASKVPIQAKLILGIDEDISHNIWIADYTGLYKIRNSFFRIFSLPPVDGGANWYFPFLNSKNQVNIFRDKIGLLKFTRNKIQTERFISENYFRSSEIVIRGLNQVCHDNEENLWVTTRKNNLIKMTKDGKQKEINVPSSKDFAPIFITWAPNLKKMFCGASSLYTIEKDTLRVYIPPNTNKTLKNIASFFVLKNGNVLVNCGSSGLWVIASLGKAFHIKTSIPLEPNLRMNFAEDNQGKLWIAFPGTGLQRFSWVNDSVLVKEIELSAVNKELPNDIVGTMAIDCKNRLWAATLSGLVVIDTLTGSGGKEFFTFNLSNIEQLKTEISGRSTHLLADAGGDIWFTSDEKIIHYNTQLVNFYSLSPITHIEEIKLKMKKTDWHEWSSELDNYFMLPPKLSLPHSQNTLTFSFKGINHRSDDDIWYSYKLEGVDSSWCPATLSNTVSFIKLTANDFTFMVRSRNTNSMWSEPAIFSFTIRKPFWQSWWFRVLGILITSVILGLIFRVQLKRIRKRAKLENQLRDLEMKALKAQMNPHFIYNALNSIQSLVIDDKREDALDYMVKFSRLLRQVLNHSELNTVSLAKELESLKLYIQLESLRLHYSLNYSITVDENIIPEMEQIPPMIIQPFIENALWHGLSKKEGNKNLFISIKGEEEFLKFDIVDNGIGRAKASLAKKVETYDEGPRGMEITKSRLFVYNNSDNVEPISVHDIVDDGYKPGGTIITVMIRRS